MRFLISSAAFGRLCVETTVCICYGKYYVQPPSGGCVLKLFWVVNPLVLEDQPPSGGCVLKLYNQGIRSYADKTAAFGRLCVETI